MELTTTQLTVESFFGTAAFDVHVSASLEDDYLVGVLTPKPNLFVSKTLAERMKVEVAKEGGSLNFILSMVITRAYLKSPLAISAKELSLTLEQKWK